MTQPSVNLGRVFPPLCRVNTYMHRIQGLSEGEIRYRSAVSQPTGKAVLVPCLLLPSTIRMHACPAITGLTAWGVALVGSAARGVADDHACREER